MRARSENYKGIEFVQISSLPVEQKKTIYKSLNHNLIINILREDALLNDCLQYQHYITWYENVFATMVQENPEKILANSAVLSLAFE